MMIFQSERPVPSCPGPRSVRNLLVLAALGAASLLVPEGALARESNPVLIQITNNTTGTVSDPSIRSQYGDSVVFTSDGDVMGPGTSPGHNEVYYYDVNTKQTTRLTFTTGGESREGTRASDTVGAGARPEVVVFISSGDLVGQNADHNAELFVWNKTANQIVQITNTPAGVTNRQPWVSDSGKCIVFSSNGDMDNNVGADSAIPPTHYSNVDGSYEVFMYNVEDGPYPTGFFTQVSSGPAGTESMTPVTGGYIFQRQCASTAYVSDYDQTSEGYSGHNIYVFDRDSATTRVMETGELPWTIQPGEYLYPSISAASPFARGPFLVFQTDADEWRNGSDGWEIFRYRIFHPRMTQYTDYMTGSMEKPVISDGGAYITFQSNGEVLSTRHRAKAGGEPPFNADGNYEIFRSKGRKKVWQITDTTGCTNDEPSARDDATSLSFRSDCELIPGKNPAGVPQVYLYKEVFSSDPLSTMDGCKVSEGCCNVANGCYHPIYGAKPGTRGKGCLDSSAGCSELYQ